MSTFNISINTCKAKAEAEAIVGRGICHDEAPELIERKSAHFKAVKASQAKASAYRIAQLDALMLNTNR